MKIDRTYLPRAIEGWRAVRERINGKVLAVALGVFVVLSVCFLVARNLMFHNRSVKNIDSIDPQLLQEMVVLRALQIAHYIVSNPSPNPDGQEDRGGRA